MSVFVFSLSPIAGREFQTSKASADIVVARTGTPEDPKGTLAAARELGAWKRFVDRERTFAFAFRES